MTYTTPIYLAVDKTQLYGRKYASENPVIATATTRYEALEAVVNYLELDVEQMFEDEREDIEDYLAKNKDIIIVKRDFDFELDLEAA